MTLAPFVVGYFLTLVTNIGSSFEDTGKVDGLIQEVGNIHHCTEKESFSPGYDEPCLSVGYGIIGPSDNIYDESYSRYHEIMKILSRNNDFSYGQDVKLLDTSSHSKLENYLETN